MHTVGVLVWDYIYHVYWQKDHKLTHVLFRDLSIDVNPAGPLGVPDQAGSAIDIRNSFGNMGFDDRETVSLVGGGHAFGKTHGPCPEPPCGDAIGPNVHTSGFEGAWTTTPTVWTNQYFQSLLGFNWTLGESPAGQPQVSTSSRYLG